MQDDKFLMSAAEAAEARHQEIEARRAMLGPQTWWNRLFRAYFRLIRPKEFGSAIGKVLGSNNLGDAYDYAGECLSLLHRNAWRIHNRKVDPLSKLIMVMIEECDLELADELSHLYIKLVEPDT